MDCNQSILYSKLLHARIWRFMHRVTDTSGGLTHNKIDRDDGRPTTGLLLLVVIFDILYFKSYHFGQKNIKQCSLQLPLNWSITGHATHRGANDQIMSQSVIILFIFQQYTRFMGSTSSKKDSSSSVDSALSFSAKRKLSERLLSI